MRPAAKAKRDIEWAHKILKDERGIVMSSPALETTTINVDVPEELTSFKFARQKSKLAGTIRGSYFVIEGDY